MAEIQQEMAVEKERIDGTLEALQKTLRRDLLNLAVEHRIISQELSEALDEYRVFRHFFVHGYGILLSEAPMQPLAQNLPEVWNRFESELYSFVKMHSGVNTQ